MNKLLKTLTCALLGGTMLFAVACQPDNPNTDDSGHGTTSQRYDPETRALMLSLGATEGLFNPFFYTSLNDGQVISQTQASLISVTTDPKDNDAAVPAVGENYPSVALDYTETYYDQQTGGNVLDNPAGAKRTEYEFVIKNGMKFSDGEPLTINDVLFTFYVYLDTAYIGSNTMYSVDIQGLTAYRTNNANADDGAENSEIYRSRAQSRLEKLINYGIGKGDDYTLEKFKSDTEAQADYAKIMDWFKQEVTNDWATCETSWQETYKEYRFTEAWQAYLFQEGLVQVQRRQKADGSSEDMLDENGKKYTTLDPWQTGAVGAQSGVTARQAEIDAIAERTTSEKIQQYITDNKIDTDNAEEYAKLQITKEYCVQRMYNEYDAPMKLDEILMYWATGGTAYSYFLSDERHKALEKSTSPIDYIRGISTYKTRTFNGKDLGAEHDVLKIAINDVDPAAIWQFGVNVVPLHYYSGTYTPKDKAEKDYVKAFDGEHNFGVERGDSEFFDKVLKDPKKNGVPVGAGPYMASTRNGGAATNGNDFKPLDLVYYERNPYFETMGKEIENAKIKYMRYRIVDEQRIISSIRNGEADYGEPSATSENQNTVDGEPETFGQAAYDTNGFGYVGINPKYVEDIEIRRIIMRAMNPNDSIRFYGSALAKVIYRPMSSTSWAYPTDCTTYKGYEIFTKASDIENALKELGYTKSGGVYQKNGKSLTYTFIIAGAAADDHPAYGMFTAAARLLNDAGFKITVTPDVNALKSLTTGELAVWAAAWSSGVDPDMFQVYHKDSNATSVLNWGYPEILNNKEKYPTEYEIINRMSDRIDEARKTTVKATRKKIYAQCLDDLMELAVELPVYQRKDLCVYNKTIINPETLNKNANATNGLLDRIWEVNYL